MPLSGTDSVAPGVLRVECMPLDCGGAAIVVELDRAPERAWMKSLKRALLADDAMVPAIRQAIVEACHTGQIGDGLVWVVDIEEIHRIRDGSPYEA